MKRLLLSTLWLTAIMLLPACSDDLSDIASEGLEVEVIKNKQSFSEGLMINLEESFQTSVLKSNASIYPDYYGGSFIEKGELIILVTGDTILNKEKLAGRTLSSEFQVRPCKFSYNQLLEVHQKVNDFFLNKENARAIEEITMNAMGIKPQDNRIFISLKECTPEKISIFKSRVIDSPILAFELWNGPIVTHADVVPGGHVSLYSGGKPGGSTGYRAKMGSIKGVVCSGHVLSQMNSSVYRNRTIIGKVKAIRTTGQVDAAFVELNSGYEGTNSIGGRTISTSIEVMGAGGLISLRGNKNESDGTVDATGISCDVTIQSTGQVITITNCTRCVYRSEGGDSGGLIYSTNRLSTVGIHEGADTAHAYYVLAHSINDALGLTRY